MAGDLIGIVLILNLNVDDSRRTTTPAEIFDHFHAAPLNMHFGGIRKPRTYSNKALSQSNGWLLPPASDVGEGGCVSTLPFPTRHQDAACPAACM